jgi:type II secretory pathway pseudopilin PulG
MKTEFTICDLRLTIGRRGRVSRFKSLVTRHSSRVTSSAFTMVEIAISLAIIGIALVAIIGVLPLGMRTQRDNREETVINQDMTVLLEAIRSGARGLDDLTNYVYAITNYQVLYPAGTLNTYGYTNNFLTNGFNIIGLLSTPEYTDSTNGLPFPNLMFGGYSNHVVAYVRSMSGPAVEKPPQNNDIVVGDSFTYRLLCVNAPVASATPPVWQAGTYNSGDQVFYYQRFLPDKGVWTQYYMYWQVRNGTITTLPTDIPVLPVPSPPKWVPMQAPPPPDAGNEGWVPMSWQPQSYSSGDRVFWNGTTWQVPFGNAISTTDIPGNSTNWVQIPYAPALSSALRELRLMFLWPQLPNGSVGAGRQSFRTMVAGQITQTNDNGQFLYFYQAQSFTNVVANP